MPEDIIILGKSDTSKECPFDAEEVWGVNNVASHPNFDGGIASVTLVNPGEGYTKPPELIVTGGQGIVIEAPVENGHIKAVNIMEPGRGYVNPKVIIKGDGRGAEIALTASPIRKIHKLYAFDILPKEYTDEMKTHAPIVSWQDYADIKYPLDEICTQFKSQFFTNTISYMMAHAMYLKAKRIRCYGIDVSFGAPYAQENRGIEYWIGRAEEYLGISVEVPPTSHLKRTISGNLYGVRDHCNALLYLHERINLINILPKIGTYSDCLKAQNAYWVLMPKEDEAKLHHVNVQRMPDGSMNFNCPQEFQSDVHMPEEVWEFIRKILREKEAKGELPFAALSIYDKLILGHPPGGN